MVTGKVTEEGKKLVVLGTIVSKQLRAVLLMNVDGSGTTELQKLVQDHWCSMDNTQEQRTAGEIAKMLVKECDQCPTE